MKKIINKIIHGVPLKFWKNNKKLFRVLLWIKTRL